MNKTHTAWMVIYENEGKFETSHKLFPDVVEAKRSIYILEGRNVVDIVPVMFDWDEDGKHKTGMEFYADAKLAGEIPCCEN